MKQRKKTIPLLLALVAAQGVPMAACAAPKPVLQFRIEFAHTASDAAWAKTRGMFRENPGLCDELWFSTGFGMPKMEVHRAHVERLRKAFEDVRALGWAPALQIQATVGHGDGPFSAGHDYSGMAWDRWTGSKGVVNKTTACPRDPRFLGYIREMSRLYASLRPSSVWIDDDLRIDNHFPASRNSLDGCWCDRCIGAFNTATGGRWTRETLDGAARKDAKLRVAFEEFAIRAVAAVARAIGEEFHGTSPDTMLALQHCMEARRTIAAVVSALHGAGGGKPVGLRPGGGYVVHGAYYDYNPNDQLLKSLLSARCRRDFPRPEQVGLWTSEIACFPRTYGSKSAQSVIMEGFAGVVCGLDAASALVVNYGKEDESLYSRTRLRPMAEAATVLRRYAQSSDGTLPVGFASRASVDRLYRFAQSGVPVLFGIGRPCGTLSEGDLALNRFTATSSEVQRVRDELDARAGGTPAVLESPFAGMTVPRVAADGTLRNVALLNLRLDEQGPVRIRLRGVPAGARRAVWHEMRRPPVELALERDGDVCRVTVPSVGAWNGGGLFL